MLEQYYVRPETVDRVRSSWIGEAVEKYVAWLADHNHAARTICRRIPIVIQTGVQAVPRGRTITVDTITGRAFSVFPGGQTPRPPRRLYLVSGPTDSVSTGRRTGTST